MDEHLIFMIPYALIGALALLSAFGTDRWPGWLAEVCIFNAVFVNGIWAAGIAVVLLSIAGFPLGFAAILGLPVAYIVGRLISGHH